MIDASAIGMALSELAAQPATSPLAPSASSGEGSVSVAALAGDALVSGTAPSTLLGPDALLALTKTEEPPVERTTASQSMHEAPNPTATQPNIAPAVVPFAATSFELQTRLVPKAAKRQRAFDDDEDDEKRFSSLATAYESAEE